MTKEIKDKIAKAKGYPSWEEYYNWVSRSGQFPAVTAQLIEAAMDEAADQECAAKEARIKELEEGLKEFLKEGKGH